MSRWRISLKFLGYLLFVTGGYCQPTMAQPAFNIDLLEKNENLPPVDLSRFSSPHAQPEGHYLVDWMVNDVSIDSSKDVDFHHGDNGTLVPCLTSEDLLRAGVNAAVLAHNIDSEKPAACLDLANVLPDSRTTFDFQHQRLKLTIPQALMNQHARGDVPVTQWDEGINAVELNYRYSGASQRDRRGGRVNDNYLMMKNGANLGAWRLRSNGSLTSNSDDKTHWSSSATWLERDIKRWKSELTLGDAFTSGDVFEPIQVQGIGLASDDEMLPDSQKGYAPVIHGIAKSNARVTVRQNGYVLYQTYVTPGPFVINDLYPMANSGDLEVSIKESSGEVRRFYQPYSSVNQMQREGYLKYTLIAGRYYASGTTRQPLMTQFSLMRGFDHAITGFGGFQAAEQYRNISLGMGKGLGEWGALSLQLLASDARSGVAQGSGRAWQLQYTKGLEKLGTLVRIDAWRYSHDRYASLADAAAVEDDDWDEESKKSTLQVTLNQTVASSVSLFLSLNQDKYWSGTGAQRTANMGISSAFHGVSWSLGYSVTHSSEQEDNDNVMSLSLSVPLATFLPDSYVSYNTSSSQKKGVTQTLGINGALFDDRSLSYSVEKSTDSQAGQSGDVSLGYTGSQGALNASYSEDSQMTRVSYGASGGVLMHRHGVVFSQEMDGPVIVVNANGAGGVPLENQKTIRTNAAGYAVLPFATAYHRNTVSLDSHALPANVDLTNSSVTTVPTKDAIVMAFFSARVGYKALFIMKKDSHPLPFGTQVTALDNDRSQGIVANDGQVYLAGLRKAGRLKAKWGTAADQQCIAHYDLSPALTSSSPLILQQSLSCTS
ncbi:fimbrial biogenesis outer membrane usher protein [Leclercia adecarboxylata]|uniref:fimbria/pilus outer membrane usher protein n=1 Tax=Leclercia adecarboxylata TaxID=83655 RepID=UPI002DBC3B65|nr:fimbria/pilus outer membrane usher protein [Leclercia adecarboxylata]MEB6377627.1 fimbrial biogenesis outer membrane usher protein [Leclercia adecarboxylata]